MCRAATCCCKAWRERRLWVDLCSHRKKMVLSHCTSLPPWAVMQTRVSEVTVPSQHNQFKSAPRKQIQISKPDSTQSQFLRRKSCNTHLTEVLSSISSSPGAYPQSPVLLINQLYSAYIYMYIYIKWVRMGLIILNTVKMKILKNDTGSWLWQSRKYSIRNVDLKVSV